MFGGSWAKNSVEIALAFCKESRFNVSLIASHEQKKEIQKEIDSGKITFISLPHFLNESYPVFKRNVVSEMYDIQKKFTTQYLRDNTTLIEFLKAQNFDVAITTNQNYETFIAVAAGIPVIREGMFLSNIINELFTAVPS